MPQLNARLYTLNAKKGFTLISAGRLARLKSSQWRSSDINVRHSGFTLIELLVVIAIIGILAAFAFASFGGAQARARDSQRKNDLNQLQKALQLYYNDHGYFPSNAGDTQASFCWFDPQTDPCTLLKSVLEPAYIKKLPFDPKSDNFHLYKYCAILTGSTANQYYLFSGFENTSDHQINYSSLPAGLLNSGLCGNYVNGSPNAVYWVTNP